MSFIDIETPECVEKGTRNHWLVSVILSCKWKGLSQAETRALLARVIPRVPGWQKSQSLTRELSSILRSIFYHRSSLKGQSPDLVLPVWLIEAMQTNKSKEPSQKKYKKGSLRDLTNTRLVATSLPLQDPVASSSGVFSPLTSGYVRPVGSDACQAPEQLVEVQWLGFDQRIGLAEPPFLPLGYVSPNPQKDRLACESSEGLSPGSVSSSAYVEVEGGGDVFRHLSGSALSSAFSKARILTEVTVALDLEEKEHMRRLWLSKLLN